MLSDEEMKEYEAFKYYYQTNTEKGISYIPDYMCENVLNLIEKKSKEIEELKEDRDKFKKALGKRITYCNELEKDLFENCSNYVVSKDKIKAKIEYYEKIDNPVGKRVLQSLLEKE